jgi:signal transduction histidine kinase
MVEIVVADRGPGIPEEFREKVKQRFFRLDESRNTPGTGLGLNLADAVVRLHKGKLVLEDNAPGLRSVMLLPEFTGEIRKAA